MSLTHLWLEKELHRLLTGWHIMFCCLDGLVAIPGDGICRMLTGDTIGEIVEGSGILFDVKFLQICFTLGSWGMNTRSISISQLKFRWHCF